MVQVKSEKEIELMRESCRVVKDTLAFVGTKIQAGMTTKELDVLIERFIRSEGAYPSCLGYGGFPASACISVNGLDITGIFRNIIALINRKLTPCNTYGIYYFKCAFLCYDIFITDITDYRFLTHILHYR